MKKAKGLLRRVADAIAFCLCLLGGVVGVVASGGLVYSTYHHPDVFGWFLILILGIVLAIAGLITFVMATPKQNHVTSDSKQ